MENDNDPLKCTVEKWLLVQVEELAGQEFLYGYVINDGYGRFQSGHYVYTSRIVKKQGDWDDLAKDETRQVRTLSGSIYETHGPGRVLVASIRTATELKFGLPFEMFRQMYLCKGETRH